MDFMALYKCVIIIIIIIIKGSIGAESILQHHVQLWLVGGVIPTTIGP